MTFNYDYEYAFIYGNLFIFQHLYICKINYLVYIWKFLNRGHPTITLLWFWGQLLHAAIWN